MKIGAWFGLRTHHWRPVPRDPSSWQQQGRSWPSGCPRCQSYSPRPKPATAQHSCPRLSHSREAARRIHHHLQGPGSCLLLRGTTHFDRLGTLIQLYPCLGSWRLTTQEIVPQASAVYDGERVRGLAIHASHRDVARFPSRESAGYQRVIARIRRIVNSQQNRAASAVFHPVAQLQQPGFDCDDGVMPTSRLSRLTHGCPRHLR